VKKAKCVTIDASLLAEAEEAAAGLGIPLSALVEEALRRLLRQAEAWVSTLLEIQQPRHVEPSPPYQSDSFNPS